MEPPTDGAAIVTSMMLFGMIVATASGVAFDPQQSKTYGPIMAPVLIAAAVAIVVFVTANMPPGTAMLNVAECVGAAVASGQDANMHRVYVSFIGPLLGSVLVALCYIVAPMPSRAGRAGKYRFPLLEPLYSRKEE